MGVQTVKRRSGKQSNRSYPVSRQLKQNTGSRKKLYFDEDFENFAAMLVYRCNLVKVSEWHPFETLFNDKPWNLSVETIILSFM